MPDLKIRSSGDAIGAEITGAALTKPVADGDFAEIAERSTPMPWSSSATRR